MSERKIASGNNLSRQADRNYAVMAFFLPFLLLSIGYAARGIFPFGNKHLLTVDLYHQYAPFLAELRTKLLSGEGIFYSFAGGLGVNFYALFAYYLASPLNLLLLLFPAAFLTEGILVLTLIKISLAGFTFNIFLRKTFNRHGPLAVGFSTMYALSSFVIAYGWNIMWLDSLYVAPLVVLGMVYLIRDKNIWLYTLSLAYLLFVNFYMAWFVCLMTAILYIPFLFRFSPVNKPLEKLLTSLKMVFCSALGIGLSAILIWPVYQALQVTSAANDAFPSGIEKVASLFDYFGQHLILVEPTVRSGFPNIYAGVFVLLLIPIALLNTKVKLRDRILGLLAITFMVLSFSTNILNFIWHGFHYPNQLPYRNSFIYIFILLTFLYEGLPGIRQLRRETIIGFSFSIILIIMAAEKIGENRTSDYTTLLSILFVLLYTLIFVRLTDDRQYKRPITLLLLSVMIIEIGLSTSIGLYYLDKNEYFGSREGYASGTVPESIRTCASQLKSSTEDALFFRTEVYPSKTSNDPSLYGLNGLTLFASTTAEAPVSFFKELGFFSNGINSYKYDGSNIVMDSLFGIRYLILRNKSHWQENTRELIMSNDDIDVYENPFALSIGFAASSDIKFYNTHYENPLENQNQLVQAIDPDSSGVFIPALLEIDPASQADLSSFNQSDTIFSFVKGSDDETAELKLTLTAEEEGTYYLAFDMRGHKTSGGKITIDDKIFDLSAKSIGNAEVGYLDAGQTAEIKFTLDSESDKSGEFEFYAARLDRNSFVSSISKIKSNQLELDRFSSDFFSGSIVMPENGFLLLTIPYDRGWQATVDGQKQFIDTVDNSLMALELSAGEHVVSMSFEPYGFKDGVIVTLGSLAILLIIALLQLLLYFVRKKKRSERAVPLATSPVYRQRQMPSHNSKDEEIYETDELTLPEVKEVFMKEIRFYLCKECGNLVVLLNEGAGQMVCCDEPMVLLEAMTYDENDFEHAPNIERTDQGIRVKVGFIAHPMTEDHYVNWIVAVQGKRYQIQFLDPGEEPEAEFRVSSGPVDVYEFCNRHGLWKTGIE